MRIRIRNCSPLSTIQRYGSGSEHGSGDVRCVSGQIPDSDQPDLEQGTGTYTDTHTVLILLTAVSYSGVHGTSEKTLRILSSLEEGGRKFTAEPSCEDPIYPPTVFFKL